MPCARSWGTLHETWGTLHVTDADRQAFAVEMAIAAEVFGETLSKTRAEAYFQALVDLDIGTVQRAFRRAVRVCKFFPKPADLREQAEGSTGDRALLAWTRLLKAVERVGTYQSVDFGDPVLHAVIMQIGGWGELWRLERMTAKELSFERAHFVRLYEALDDRPVDNAPKRLMGQAEGSNRATSGTWSHGLDHVDETIAIDGQGQRALPPAPMPKPLEELT
jgi:hypothetical protein